MAATPERRPFWGRGAGFELSLPLRPEALSLEKIAVQSLQYATFLRWPLQESEDHFAWGDRRFESPSLRQPVCLTGASHGLHTLRRGFRGSMSLDETRERDVLATSRLASAYFL